jgi:quinol monooxygenase YgiN
VPVTTILDLQIKPDAVDQAIELLHRILADTRAFDGCQSVAVVQDHADPAHLIAIEQWESLEHDAAYRRWRAGEGAIVELSPLLAGVPRTSICEPRADV